MNCCRSSPVYVENNLTNLLRGLGACPERFYDVAKEDRLAFEKLRLEVYKLLEQRQKSVNEFDFALFVSMSLQCHSILNAFELYTKKKNVDRRRRLQEEVLKATYRFSLGFGGYSQLVTHTLLSNLDFCVSVFFSKPQKLLKIRFAPTTVALVRREEEMQYMPTNELRLSDRTFKVQKSSAAPSVEEEMVLELLKKGKWSGLSGKENFRRWKVLAASIQDSVQTVRGNAREWVGILMRFEGG